MTHSKTSKNYRLLLRTVTIRVLILLAGWIVLALILQKPSWVFSAILGAVFSFFILRELMITNSLIVQTRKSTLFFPRMLMRLGLYAVPIVLYFRFETVLNIYVILVFLLAFQGMYIASEVIRSISRLKNKK